MLDKENRALCQALEEMMIPHIKQHLTTAYPEYAPCPNTQGRFVPSHQANGPSGFRSVRITR